MNNDKLTLHFSKKEFSCKCGCGTFNLDMRIPQMLEKLREDINRRDAEDAECKKDMPIIVMSACRCERHNAAVGGTKNSYHIAKGLANGEWRMVNDEWRSSHSNATVTKQPITNNCVKPKICKAVDITVSGLKMSELMYIVETRNIASLQQAGLPIWTGRGIYLAKNIIHLDIGEREKVTAQGCAYTTNHKKIINPQSAIRRWIDISRYCQNFGQYFWSAVACHRFHKAKVNFLTPKFIASPSF